VILQWIDAKMPGQVLDVGDELRVRHLNGETSSLWRRDKSTAIPPGLHYIREMYEDFDGADLFSSAFKVAAISGPKIRNGVPIAPALSHLQEEALQLGCRFPKGAIPFMVQAGIGLYAVAVEQPLIYEWDSSEGEITGEYPGVIAILDEWLAAID
jgi:hypothetical protein